MQSHKLILFYLILRSKVTKSATPVVWITGKIIEEKRNPVDNYADNVLHKYQKPPKIIASWFHWEIKFAEQVLLVSSVWSSKEINSNFESTDIVRSNVGMATIYITAPDKQRIRVSAS